MKKVKRLISHLQENKFEVDLNDGKVHILYLTPFLNATGLYRTMLPAMHMNETDTHHAVITGIQQFNFNTNEQAPKILHVDSEWRMAEWAHYIVVPTIMDAEFEKNIIAGARAVNPHVQFVFDIDDLYEFPLTHPIHSRLTNADKAQLLKNISLCNVLTGTSTPLVQHYLDKARAAHPASQVEGAELPNLLSKYCYQGLQAPPKLAGDKIRIGLTINSTQYGDLAPFRKILHQAQQKYKGKIELIVFGWNGHVHNANGARDMNKSVFRGIKHTYIKPVGITQYFQAMHNLQLDFALMPLAKEPKAQRRFNEMKSSHKFLQYAALKIPAIIPDISTYTYQGAAIPGDNCLQAKTNKEWLQHIDTLVTDAHLRKTLGQEAYTHVMENFMLNEKTINIWLECFYDYTRAE